MSAGGSVEVGEGEGDPGELAVDERRLLGVAGGPEGALGAAEATAAGRPVAYMLMVPYLGRSEALREAGRASAFRHLRAVA
jgi:hypothetical protein